MAPDIFAPTKGKSVFDVQKPPEIKSHSHPSILTFLAMSITPRFRPIVVVKGKHAFF
jgi:hypothetical protein